MRACLVLQIQYSCGVMGQSRMEADTNTLRGCVTLGKSLNLSEPVLPHLESEIAGRTIWEYPFVRTGAGPIVAECTIRVNPNVNCRL